MIYQIQIALHTDFKELVINDTVDDIQSYTVSKKLDYFTTYYWRVKSIDDYSGISSDWSDYCVFKVRGQDIEICHVGGNSVTFTPNKHSYIRDYDTECVIPDANIGVCLDEQSIDAQIGVKICGMSSSKSVCDSVILDMCVGECTSLWVVEYLITQDDEPILTEDGVIIFV